ncbi:MAG TPA: thiamine pyrophosphate-binding protein [Burkholderiales bacterium]|nr:thiamine pyrophosphate-binding protein [Burkholderiales bacterium]
MNERAAGLGMTGAEAVLRVLRSMGVERIFASPGSDWAPLWEALAKPYAAGEVPEYISSRHEETAIGMAAGYAKATGKLPALVLHTTVGALHATMGLRAALHERIPMVVMAGESVSFAEPPAAPAGRQWLRVLTDLGGPARLVQDTVKWSFGLNASNILPHTVQRACQLAMSAPRGPVFVSVPTEILMDTMSAEPPAVAALPALPVANEEAIADVAAALNNAKRPVIISEELGRNPGAVDELVRLAEALGAPVLDGWHPDYVNFPRDHALYAGVAVEPVHDLLRDADFILLAEAVAGWHPASAVRGTKVAVLGEDPLHSHLPFWGFRADYVLQGDVELTLRQLTKAVADPEETLDQVEDRRKSREWLWLTKHDWPKRKAELVAKARQAGEGQAITAAWAAHELNAVLPADAIVVNETISHSGDLSRLLDKLRPGAFYEATYGGLGMGLGTALGVKHAQPGRPVVLTIGDGSFYYNAVPAAFGACQEHKLPMLIVLFDNAGYFSQKNDVVREYPNGWAVRSNKFAGTSIAPQPDYAMLAKAFGGRGEKVERPRDVRPALERGLQALAKGQLALVHLVLEPVNR